MKNSLSVLSLTVFAFSIIFTSNAQVKIGENPTAFDININLKVEATGAS